MKKIFKGFTIKARLIITFAIILILPTVIVGAESFLTAKNAVKDEMLSGFSQTVDIINSSIDDTIQPEIHDVDFFSKMITSQIYQGDTSLKLRQQFNQYVQLHPEAQSIYVGTGTAC